MTALDTAGTDSSRERTRPPLETASALGGVWVTLENATHIVELPPDLTRGAPGAGMLQTPYHTKNKATAQGVKAFLRWTAPRDRQRPRLIRLMLTADDDSGDTGGKNLGIPSGSVRWSWIQRAASEVELQGGAALTAQDTLSPDGRTLTLLLLPDEARDVQLEFDVTLSVAEMTGDYPFRIVATDAENPALRDDVIGLLRLVHPPSRLLDYLPALWREEMYGENEPEENRGDNRLTRFAYTEPPFFARFLRGFEDVLDPIAAALDNRSALFSATSAPADLLPWLASWVGLALDESWPEMRRRQLIREAVDLYRWRGTRRGLSRYLEIYAGVAPEIVDQPVKGMRLGAADGTATLGNAAAKIGNIAPHTFVVTIAAVNPALLREETVRAIIEAQKPAHTTYTLRILAAA